MLFPRSHAWTPLQKWLVTSAVVLVVSGFGALIYSYERYHRGPSESLLYGTWQVPVGGDNVYFQLNPDQTFSVRSLFEGAATPLMKGRWYAGGQNIYLRFSAEDMGERRPLIWHIVDIEPTELRIRMFRNQVVTYKRVNLESSRTSNQSR